MYGRILYPMGDFLDNKKRTLIELVVKNFVEAKKKINVNRRKTRNRNPQNYNSPISIVLINSAIKEITSEDKEGTSEKEDLEETTGDVSEDKNKIIINGGYGTVSKHYGISQVVKYTNYSRIWSHLGTFRAKSMYENSENSNEIAMGNGESTREMISRRTLERAARIFKYFMRPAATLEAHPDMYTVVGLAPPPGANIDSKEWEKYLLMMKMSIYQPLLKLEARMA